MVCYRPCEDSAVLLPSMIYIHDLDFLHQTKFPGSNLRDPFGNTVCITVENKIAYIYIHISNRDAHCNHEKQMEEKSKKEE